MTDKQLPTWFDERIEAWLDDELSGSEAALFEARLATDPLLEREIERATRLGAQLQDLPGLQAPSSLSRNVMEITGNSFALPKLAFPAWGWSLGGACAAALALMVTLGPAVLPGGEPELQPTAQELAKARADLALALGYVDQAGNMAARQLGGQAGALTVRGLLEPARRLNSDGADTI